MAPPVPLSTPSSDAGSLHAAVRAQKRDFIAGGLGWTTAVSNGIGDEGGKRVNPDEGVRGFKVYGAASRRHGNSAAIGPKRRLLWCINES